MAMDGVVVRRVMDADNSCLFKAMAYVTLRSRERGAELRQLLASTVASDPQTYDEALLEKSNAEYVAWLARPDSWGGAIELSILADHFKCRIAAFDIRSKRCDIYAQDKPYTEFVMLLYDGVHYDALAVSPAAGAPEDFDQTILPASSFEAASRQALALVESLHRARQFTDTSSFKLRCGVCQKGLTGQQAAVEHAQMTGHANFQEC